MKTSHPMWEHFIRVTRTNAPSMTVRCVTSGSTPPNLCIDLVGGESDELACEVTGWFPTPSGEQDVKTFAYITGISHVEWLGAEMLTWCEHSYNSNTGEENYWYTTLGIQPVDSIDRPALEEVPRTPQTVVDPNGL